MVYSFLPSLRSSLVPNLGKKVIQPPTRISYLCLLFAGKNKFQYCVYKKNCETGKRHVKRTNSYKRVKNATRNKVCERKFICLHWVLTFAVLFLLIHKVLAVAWMQTHKRTHFSHKVTTLIDFFPKEHRPYLDVIYYIAFFLVSCYSLLRVFFFFVHFVQCENKSRNMKFNVCRVVFISFHSNCL